MADRTAAVVALATYIVGGSVAIGWRLCWQWRRTGSTGFKGVSGTIGSAEWFVGLGFILGVLVTVAAPVLQLAGIVDVRVLARQRADRAEHRGDRGLRTARGVDRVAGPPRGEPYLLKVHGGSYREYAGTVGRFVPRTGLIH